MKKLNFYKLILVLVFMPAFLNAQVIKELKCKMDSKTKLWGFENEGEQEYWWKQAHSQGKNEELLNGGYKTEWCISPQYTSVAKRFSEQLAGVELNGKVGFIDKYNRFLVKPQFDVVTQLEGFRYGLAAVKQNGKFGFINMKGDFVIPPIYDYAENFEDNMLATVKLQNKFGAIDFKGDTIVSCRFIAQEAMKLLPFTNKAYKEAERKVKTRYEEGYYDRVLKPIEQVAQNVNKQISDSLWQDDFQEEIALIEQNNLLGMKYQENDTNWILRPEYEDIIPLSKQYFMLVKENKKGVSDHYGRVIIPCEFADISLQAQERLFIVKKDSLSLSEEDGEYVGLYNCEGAMILPPVFETINSFVEGKASACIAGECTTIDVHGQVEDNYIDRLLNIGNQKENLASMLFYKRLIGITPTFASAHNNLGIYFLDVQLYKKGMQHIKMAHKLDPENEQIALNLKQAKSDRKERRHQRVMTVLEVATAVVNTASVTYAAAKGVDSYQPALSSSSSSSLMPDNTSSSSKKASNNSGLDRNANWMKANYQSMKRTYSNDESLIIKMKNNPSQYSDSSRMTIQARMKKTRDTIVKNGGTCSQSQWETWRP